jgi:predicted MFS family arabinose efflux permease
MDDRHLRLARRLSGRGIIILAIGFPMVALLAHSPKSLAEKRKAAGEEPDINPIGHIGATRGEALRQPVFYLVFFAIAFGSMSLLATMQHAVPLLTERGLPINTATTVMSCAFAGVIIGQLSSGVLADRFNSPRVVLPYFICALAGVLVVHSQNDPRVLIPGALLMGWPWRRDQPERLSRLALFRVAGIRFDLWPDLAASAAGNGTGVILLGYIRDHFGTYAPGIWLVGGAMSLSAACVALMPRFVYESPNASHK